MGNSKTKPVQDSPKSDDPNCTPPPSTSQLQVRNCVRNVRNIGNTNFSEIYPDTAYGGPSAANAPPVYTIDINTGAANAPTNYTNAAYVITENAKTSRANDGLPTYEEAMSGLTHSMGQQCALAPPPPPPTTIPIELDGAAPAAAPPKRGRRHRHHQRHNRRPRCDAVPAGPAADQPNATFSAVYEHGAVQPGEDAAAHGRRGRRHNHRLFRNQRRQQQRQNQNQQE